MKTIAVLSSALLLIFSSCSLEIPMAVSEENEIDHYELSVANMNGITQSWENEYVCTGDTSKLDIDPAINAGQLHVVIKDDADNEIFNEIYNRISSDEQLVIAPAGRWKVEVHAKALTGSIAIELKTQK
jgi:hypothetical protein